MDTFVEQIVTKRRDGRDMGIIGLILFGMLALVVACAYFFMYIGMFALIIIAGAGYGAWFLLSSRNIEFEYSVTNGDIDIDTIIARRKRNRLVSVSGSKLESFEPYEEAAYASRKFDRTVMAAPSTKDEGLWAFTYRSKKNGRTLVIFQPEKRVVSAFKIGLPSMMAREVTKKMEAMYPEDENDG